MGRVDKCWVWVRLGSGFEIFLGFKLGFEIFLWVWVGMMGSGLGLFIITFFPKIDPPYPFFEFLRINFFQNLKIGRIFSKNKCEKLKNFREKILVGLFQ